jgi:hypothetical protein
MWYIVELEKPRAKHVPIQLTHESRSRHMSTFTHMYDFRFFAWDFVVIDTLGPMSITYAVPTNPADPESAALELIVQLPTRLLATHAFTPVLQDFCGLLHAESALVGLSWNDARQVWWRQSLDARQHDDAAPVLRARTRDVLAGSDGMP